jgi:hypothetical protein
LREGEFGCWFDGWLRFKADFKCGDRLFDIVLTSLLPFPLAIAEGLWETAYAEEDFL